MYRILLTVLLVAACGGGETQVYNLPDLGGDDAGAGDRRDAASSGDDWGTGILDAGEDGSSPPPPSLRDDLRPIESWKGAVERAIDHDALPQYFAESGFTLPAGSAVYVARVVDGAIAPGYQMFDAGDGAFDMSFWPASTIKLLSAIGALEWVYTHGYTGATRVDWDSGFGDVLRSIYQRAIGVSSNIDYDRTLRAAGWDFMNAEFLTPERGFPRTVITASYASVEVRNPGGYTLSENGQSKYIAARAGVGEYGRNDTDLYELTEGVRRIMLHNEIPEAERFRIDPVDVVELQAALCGATPSYFKAGADAALGGSTVCHKPGWVPDNECLDHGLVTGSDGSRYLVAASIPYATNCPGLAPIAERALGFLKQQNSRVPLQPDSSMFAVQIDAGTVTVQVSGADEVVLWVDGVETIRATDNDRGQFILPHSEAGEHFVAVGAYSGGEPVEFRSGLASL